MRDSGGMDTVGQFWDKVKQSDKQGPDVYRQAYEEIHKQYRPDTEVHEFPDYANRLRTFREKKRLEQDEPTTTPVVDTLNNKQDGV